MTKIAQALDLNGWVFYDGSCPLCCSAVARFDKVLTRRGFDIVPLQAPWVTECFDLQPLNPPRQMLVLSADGRLLAGLEGILFLARSVWWAWPLYAVGLMPPVRALLHLGYGWLSAHRMCFGGQCAVNPQNQ
jgi:predicted DCC family thiol-disulfide oxidoreductase YuxK